eukprot:m.371993 g.371993  ORF g.371993 m.371993 type:complete len:64 (+) comp61150_c0_seq1:126-317(+)
MTCHISRSLWLFTLLQPQWATLPLSLSLSTHNAHDNDKQHTLLRSPENLAATTPLQLTQCLSW